MCNFAYLIATADSSYQLPALMCSVLVISAGMLVVTDQLKFTSLLCMKWTMICMV